MLNDFQCTHLIKIMLFVNYISIYPVLCNILYTKINDILYINICLLYVIVYIVHNSLSIFNYILIDDIWIDIIWLIKTVLAFFIFALQLIIISVYNSIYLSVIIIIYSLYLFTLNFMFMNENMLCIWTSIYVIGNCIINLIIIPFVGL